MKPKDIITVVVAVVIIGVSGYFGYSMLFPSKKSAQTKTQSETTTKVPTSIDEKTYTSVNTLSDYGKPSVTGLGKADLFADF